MKRHIHNLFFQVEEGNASFLPPGKRALPCHQRNKICHLTLLTSVIVCLLYMFLFKCECDCMQRSVCTKQGACGSQVRSHLPIEILC